MLCINSVNIDGIECIRNPYVLYQQYQHIEPIVSALQNCNRIKNRLNIKKIMSKNVYVNCIDSVNIDSIKCIRNPYVLYQQYRHTLIQY